MVNANHDDELIDELAEEFAGRLRAGERPAIEEYVTRLPAHAEQLRAVLSAVEIMEQSKPQREPAPLLDFGPKVLERIGEYRIIREIGRGGMGVVYEAEQEALSRRVAIKVLPAHLLGNDKLLARFRRESQAAARLHHTNIVPVFGVGETAGQCYYVMQMIVGRGLDQIIRETSDPQSELTSAEMDPDRTEAALAVPAAVDRTAPPAGASGGRKPLVPEVGERRGVSPPVEAPVTGGLTPRRSPKQSQQGAHTPRSPEWFRTVAQIGARVADALAYAHSQGVLHRDIKPSNLLLDERGTVWVTDFGVAKLVEEVNLTASGDVVGTLKYMPPERFAGQSDGRGDVYSLGMTLYELLTFRSAFPDTTPQHLIRLISHETPPRPRALNPLIPRDLETIVLKATARDAGQRYQSAGELAEDLGRYLDDRPIRARRANSLQLAWRWCRRNPALAMTTATILLLLNAVAVVSVVGNVRTKDALEREKEQRQHAEDTATLALEALNQTYEHFAPTRLVVAPRTESEDGVEVPSAALPPEAIGLLEVLMKTYERLAREGGDYPKLRAAAAEANLRIGDIRQRLGQFEEAAAAYRVAIERYEQLLMEDSAADVRSKLARAYNDRGQSLRALRQGDERRQMHELAIRTLTDAPAPFTRLPQSRYELARAHFLVGQHDMLQDAPQERGGKGGPFMDKGKGKGKGKDKGPPPEKRGGPPPGPFGNPSARQAAEILEQLVKEHPKEREYRHLLACCYREGASPGPFGAKARNSAIELLRQLVKDFPRVPDYLFDLCETLAPVGPAVMVPNRKERLKEAIRLSEQLVKQYPNVPDYAAAHARYHDLLAMALFEQGPASEAVPVHRKAISLQKELVGKYPDVLAHEFWLGLMERSLGRTLLARGEVKEARTLLQSAVSRAEALRKKDPRLGGVLPFLGMAYRELATALRRDGEPGLAAEAQRKAEEFPGRMQPGPGRP